MFYRILIALFVIQLFPQAEIIAQPGPAQQKVSIIQDSRINHLLDKHIYINDKEKLHGWRIQIFFDSGNNSKSRAYSKKGLFMAKYPEVDVYLTFQSPYYKVRVGNYRTRMDAEGFKNNILDDFPDAFVVKDEIQYPYF